MSLTSNNNDTDVNKKLDNTDLYTKVQNETIIELELADIIKILAPRNELLNEQTFIIDYIDNNKIVLIDADSLNKIILDIDKDNNITDTSITQISILSRSDLKGYARQNDLLPNTWVNIYFGGNIPAIITGKITNLEEDMIEVTTYPENETLYINFEYKGLPENIPIETIEIREEPEQIKEKIPDEEIAEPQDIEEIKRREQRNVEDIFEGVEGIEGLEDVEYMYGDLGEIEKQRENVDLTKIDIAIPIKDIKNQVREVVIRQNQIQFGDEYLGPVTQFHDVDVSKQRYSIETQTSDLLDELLSTIPNVNRTDKVLNNIHMMIERFVQLREHFSNFDEYGNVKDIKVNTANYKPLWEYFKDFKQKLLWLLPVVKNVRKIYDFNDNTDLSRDVEFITINDDIKKMKSIFDSYKANELFGEDNKYVGMFKELNPHLTPFNGINDEDISNIIYEKDVMTELNVIIDNLDDFYSSVIDNMKFKSRKFLIQKYNLGMTKLEPVTLTGSRMIAKRVKLSNPDFMSIKSFITLPEPVIRFSRVNLNTASILDRSNLNNVFINYWKFLNNKTELNNIVIDNTEQVIEYNSENFANNIKNYILNLSDIDKQGYTNFELYKKFVEIIIPKTKILFNLMKKYITGRLSIVEVVNFLEPFLVYSDSLTYMQYLNIIRFINNQISKYNKDFVEKSKLFMLLSKTTNDKKFREKAQTILHIIKSNEARDDIFRSYDILDTKETNFTNSEILKILYTKDNLRLYSTALSKQNISLMLPTNLSSIFSSEQQLLKEESSNIKKDCKNIVISKLYRTREELEKDNDAIIYFDKAYDKTNYGILDFYEKEMLTMGPDDFLTFLINKLKTDSGLKLYLDQQGAESMAEALLNGYKKVNEGDYAVLYDVYSEDDKTLTTYYIRKNNKWVLDDTLNDFDVTTSDLLCNLQDMCLTRSTNNEDKCENVEESKLDIRTKTLKNIIGEFDKSYNSSKEEMERNINDKIELLFVRLPLLNKIEMMNLLKYSNEKYLLSYNTENEGSQITSPVENLKNLILGQQDFLKQQKDIIRFVNQFTRESVKGDVIGPLGEYESEHWLYCKQTNIRMLPKFKFTLASVYINNNKYYDVFLQQLIKEIGKLSDDGDCWVDKYTGSKIMMIDFDVEEGYEEGFKVSTRDVIEEDIGTKMLDSSMLMKNNYQTPLNKTIINMINVLSSSIGINIDKQKDFILICVNDALNKNIPKETDYKQKAREMANKGKSIPSFEEFYNASLLYYTLSMFLIGLQTHIPNIKTKMTFAGCIKSFTGYPVENDADLSSLNYLSCVAYEIRNSGEPWNVLMKSKKSSSSSKASIATKIKDTIDKYFIDLPDIKRKIAEKVEYLLVNPSENIPDEYSVTKWNTFLPPLMPFSVKSLVNVSSEFNSSLLSNLRNGDSNQTNQIQVIESKIFYFSLALQEKIADVLKHKRLLLQKISNEPFLENACCNDKNELTTLQYFAKEDQTIEDYNKIVKNLSNTLYDISFYTKANTFYYNKYNKVEYPIISKDFNSYTIFLAFIKFCNFKNIFPIDANLLPLCSEKPKSIHENDTINEIIIKLKNEGIDYSNEDFLRLLQLVSRNNIINLDIYKPSISCMSKLNGLLDIFEGVNDKTLDMSFVKKLKNSMDTFDVATEEITKETKELNNFLINNIERTKIKISEFILENKSNNITKKKIKMVTNFIDNIDNWSILSEETKTKNYNAISNNSLYNVINFYKYCIECVSTLLPTSILNSVDYTIKVHKYLDLSLTHQNKITNFVENYYKNIKQHYNNTTLYSILNEIQPLSTNMKKLAINTPAFTSIKLDENKTLKAIFNERTSKLLFEYYLLKTVEIYVELTDDPNMLVLQGSKNKKIQEQNERFNLSSVDYANEQETKTNIEYNDRPLIGKKLLKQNVASLLISIFEIIEDQKDSVDMRYEKISDLVFKTKEYEKNIVTDRLKNMTDEERNADTILKINKLGVWSKGLQKGLTTYVKENFDDEREFMENMMRYEKTLKKKTGATGDVSNLLDDFVDEMDRNIEIERDAYDMSGYIDDYYDGNFEGDEVENYGDYE